MGPSAFKVSGQRREEIPGEGVTCVDFMYVWDEGGLRDEQGVGTLSMPSGNVTGRFLA